MKIIKDIRLYKAKHNSLGNRQLNLAVHRVVMKLRENEFSLGDYDHLYLCFSTERPAGSVVLDNEADRYFPWFRYVYVGVTADELHTLETAQEPSYLFLQIERIFISLFGGQCADVIGYAIEQARKGPEMLMHFKEKKSAKGTAAIYLRLLDNASYLPLLLVTKPDGTEVLRADLPETADLGSIGEIQLSSKKVTVKPRKNSYTAAKALEPVSFEIKL